MSTIEDRVKTEIARQLGMDTADVKNEANLADDYGADSLDQVELVMALEDEFEIEIPDEVGDAFKTAQQVIDYITKRIG